MNCPPRPRNLGFLPLGWQQNAFAFPDKNCLPTAFFILSGQRLTMTEADIGDEKKTIDVLVNAGETVEHVCRATLEHEYKSGLTPASHATPLADEEFFERVEAHPSILFVEHFENGEQKCDPNGNRIDHAIACVGCVKINPLNGLAIEQSVRTYFQAGSQPRRIFAAYVFPKRNIDECQNRVLQAIGQNGQP